MLHLKMLQQTAIALHLITFISFIIHSFLFYQLIKIIVNTFFCCLILIIAFHHYIYYVLNIHHCAFISCKSLDSSLEYVVSSFAIVPRYHSNSHKLPSFNMIRIKENGMTTSSHLKIWREIGSALVQGQSKPAILTCHAFQRAAP